MNRRVKTALGFLIALVAAVVIAHRLPPAPSAPPAPSSVLSPPSVAPAPAPSATPGAAAQAVPRDRNAGGPVARAAFGSRVGFRTRHLLVEHYQKHGREFGDATQEDYLRMAQALRDRPAAGEVLERVRADGTITRFDRAAGSFLAFDPDGTIRTFFKPRDGERYFRRQALRQTR